MHKRIRGRFFLIALLAGLVSGACTSYQPLTSPAPVGGPAVRLAFAAPRPVLLKLPRGDSLVLDHVADITGPIEGRTGDTLVVKVWSARSARDADLRPPPGATAVIVLERGVTVTARGPDAPATRRLALGMVVGVVVAAVALYWIVSRMYAGATT